MRDFLLHGEFLSTLIKVFVSPHELLTLFKGLENDEVHRLTIDCDHDHFTTSISKE